MPIKRYTLWEKIYIYYRLRKILARTLQNRCFAQSRHFHELEILIYGLSTAVTNLPSAEIFGNCTAPMVFQSTKQEFTERIKRLANL
jgi:hypothetical protein